MVSVETIEKEIIELEARDTSYAVCERLAWLYTVRDHLRRPRDEPRDASRRVDSLSGSEFLEAVSGRDLDGVMGVLSEHMEAIRVVAPREYERVIERIRAV